MPLGLGGSLGGSASRGLGLGAGPVSSGAEFEEGFDPYLARGTAPVSGFLEQISRPGWALRSALAGDFEAAGKHVAQFAMDLPAGWIDKRLSLSNAFFDSGDITDADEKYEFSDLLEQWGLPAPREGTWGRTGVDIVGGLIDPLTFIGGPIAGMGRKALVGAGTTVGREILEASLKSGRSGFANVLGSKSTWEGLGDAAKAQKLDEVVYNYLPAKARSRAGITPNSIEWERLAEDELEGVVKGLRKDGFVDTPSISSIGIPFGPHMQFGTEAGEKFFQKFPAMEKLWRYKDHAVGYKDHALGSLWDRTLKYAHKLPPGFRAVVNKSLGERNARESFIRDDIYKSFATDEGLAASRASSPILWDELGRLGKTNADNADLYKSVLNHYVPQGTGKSPSLKASLVGTLTEHVDDIDLKDVSLLASDLDDVLREALKDELRQGRIIRRPSTGADAVSIDFEAIVNGALRPYGKQFTPPPSNFRVFADIDPVGGKKWGKALRNPASPQFDTFSKNWASHILKGVGGQIQARDIVHKLGANAGWDNLSKGNLQQALAAARNSGDYEAYANRLQGLWKDAVDSPLNMPGADYSWMGLDKTGAAYKISNKDLAIPGEAAMSVPEVAHQRLLKRSSAVTQKHVKDLSKSLVPSLGIDAKVFEDYMHNVFGEIKPDRGMIRKLLAGGELTDELVPSEKLKEAVLGTKKGLGGLTAVKTYRTKEGLLRQKTIWGGVNRMWKPLLTSAPTNLDYHFRNTLSSVFMLATDPNVGWTGVHAALKMPAMMMGIKNNHMEAYLKALHTNPAKAIEGMKALKGLSGKVGTTGLTHEEFITGARTFLGGGRSHDTADLMRELGDTMALLQHSSKKANLVEKGATKFARAGENMSNWVENQMRLHSFQKNLEAGLTIPDAARRTQTTLVDYAVQSKFDRMVRDIFPFIRFRIGSMAWTGAVLTRPRNLQALAQLHRSSEDGQRVANPDRLKSEWDNLNISLPGGLEIPTGAGAQSTLENFGILLGGVSLGNYGNFKQILTEAHPVFNVLLDATYGKELYSGKPFAADVRAEGYQKLLPGVETGVSRWGVEREEISGVAKVLLENSPISRQLRLVNKAFEVYEGETGMGAALFRQVAGVRQNREDALIDMRNRLEAILKSKINDGSIYEYLMPLSSRRPEDTPPEIKLLIEELRNVKGRIRDRRKGETRADGRLGLATGGRGF